LFRVEATVGSHSSPGSRTPLPHLEGPLGSSNGVFDLDEPFETVAVAVWLGGRKGVSVAEPETPPEAGMEPEVDVEEPKEADLDGKEPKEADLETERACEPDLLGDWPLPEWEIESELEKLWPGAETMYM